MRKLLCLLFALALLSLAGTVLAADDVATTKHNLSTSGTGTYKLTAGTSEVCVFCHTPHGASTTVKPLWNRNDPAGAFTMYSSPTIDMTIAASPQGVSLACLSCHDGVTAFDAFVSAPDMTGWTWAGAVKVISGSANLGTNLSNDHPISITYDTTKDPAFVAASVGKVGTLPLYGAGKDQVECGSCHNPHNNTIGPFLRVSNANSGLCKTCHTK